jgi:hypothetical protein
VPPSRPLGGGRREVTCVRVARPNKPVQCARKSLGEEEAMS